jgi:dolichol-phosphate mannosyltransferase
MLLGVVGFAILLYLTMLKLWGEAIGHRPLLTLGVLLVVVGIQFVSLGLLSELVTSQHEERLSERERIDLVVEEILH